MPHDTASTPLECSPTDRPAVVGLSHSFGGVFMPDYYPCPIARLVSCYALFK